MYLFIPPIPAAQAAEPSTDLPGNSVQWSVDSEDLSLYDSTRGKILEIRVTYPVGAGTYPVIIFSHGAGGSRTAATPLVNYWVSHGYIVIAPTHADSIELCRREYPEEVNQWREDGGRLFMAKMLRNIARSPGDWANRAADLSFLLDNLQAISEQVRGLTGKMDDAKIGISGHSYGAYTTMLVGGATLIPPGSRSAVSYADPRADALLVLSGQGVGRLGLVECSWDSIEQPMMVMSGTGDNAAGGQDVISRRDPFAYAPPGDKYLVWIEDAFHASFPGGLVSGEPGARGKCLRVEWVLGNDQAAAIEETDQVAVFECVKASTLAYWDCYLKGDQSTLEWLLAGNLAKVSGAGVEFLSK